MDPVPVEAGIGPLFRRGQPPKGIYLVLEGQVRLQIAPEAKPGEVWETAGPGTVLGLAETMGGGDYKLTAEPAPGARIGFIDRHDLLKCLHRDQQLCMQIVRLLSEDLRGLYFRFRCLAESTSRPRKQSRPTIQ
jgi:CRP-like cAMP-binding protein